MASSTIAVSSGPPKPYSFVISAITGPGNLPVVTDASIRILPNPSDGNFAILITGNVEKGRLRIWDAIGRELYSQQFERIVPPVTIPIPMNGMLGKGVYLVMLITDKGVLQEKLLIQYLQKSWYQDLKK